MSAGEEQPTANSPADASPAPAPEPSDRILLKYKFDPGETVRYVVHHETKITTIFNEVTEIASNTSQSRRRYKVEQVHDDGSGDLELTIEWVRMTSILGDGSRQSTPIEFQSDDPSRQPESFRHIQATVGRPRATIRFSSAGRAVELSSSEPADKTDAAAAVPGSDASAENYLLVLPDQPVGFGESWTERFEIVARNSQNLPLRIRMRRQYKLTEYKDNLATIEFRTAVLTPIEDPAIQAQLIQRETAGTLVFDVERGRLVSREVMVDRTVLYPFGPKSSMHAVSKYSEKLLTGDLADGRKSGDAAGLTAAGRPSVEK